MSRAGSKRALWLAFDRIGKGWRTDRARHQDATATG